MPLPTSHMIGEITTAEGRMGSGASPELASLGVLRPSAVCDGEVKTREIKHPSGLTWIQTLSLLDGLQWSVYTIKG